MNNAEEMRKIALEKQEYRFSHNYDKCVYRIDEKIKWISKECGETSLCLESLGHHIYREGDSVFIIDKKTFKEIKKYYQTQGFKIKKFINIYIYW